MPEILSTERLRDFLIEAIEEAIDRWLEGEVDRTKD